MNRPVLKLQPRPTMIACSECAGSGLVKLWPPGHEERAHMGRCEQCSGLGKVKA